MNNNSTFWNHRSIKPLMQGTQIDNSPIEKISTTKKLSIPTLMEEMNIVVVVEYEFENREKFKIERFSLDFLDYYDSVVREKKNDFSNRYLPKSPVFSVEILTEETELIAAEK